MSDLNEIYSEKNLGIPVKVYMGSDKNGKSVYVYGRYYGRGYDGESIKSDEDYYMLAIVTPAGSLIRGGSIHYNLISSDDDLRQLEKYEKMEENPYVPYLIKEGNKYIKSYEYKKDPLTFQHYPLKWFEDNNFFYIDESIFGNALSKLFSIKFGKDFYFQKLRSVCEANPGPIIWHEKDTKYLSIISPVQYDDEYSHYESPYVYRKRDYFDNIFKHFPTEIKDEDFLIYYGNYRKRRIRLGKVTEDKFIPNNFNPIQDYGHIDEVKFNNPSYDFVGEFINEILNYKLNNRKGDIDEQDMNNILEQFELKLNNSENIKQSPVKTIGTRKVKQEQ